MKNLILLHYAKNHIFHISFYKTIFRILILDIYFCPFSKIFIDFFYNFLKDINLLKKIYDFYINFNKNN